MSLNPWAFLVLFFVGALIGFGGAWSIQRGRLDRLHAEFDTLVADTKSEGEKARIIAEQKDRENQNLKEVADNEYETRLSVLIADNERLRNENTRRGIVPKASTTSRRPDLACFDRTEFVSAVQRLDDAVFKLVNKGDERALEVNIAREWAKSLN
jgi:hypothetical protein